MAAAEEAWQPRDFCLYFAERRESVPGPCRSLHNSCFARSTGRPGAACAKKLQARRTGVRGETYAYWYLRRKGYIFVARNYTPRVIKGEIDRLGYDGKTLTFVEVRTRTIRDDLPALPELSVSREKQRLLVVLRSVFWRKVTSVSVPAGSRSWQLITAPDNRRRFACTRMPSAPKFEARSGNLFRVTRDAVQFRVSWLLT